jgi:polyphosphate kinase
MKLADLVDRDDLKFSPYEAFVPQQLAIRENLFDQISKNDHLLHHPYDSFSPIVEFLRQAAIDPEVFAIKLTIYRTSGDSPIVKALMDAAQNGSNSRLGLMKKPMYNGPEKWKRSESMLSTDSLD